mmetsp:Transcript_2739/g.8216  ORF Transcript_2739/g.8216 Transcript_2739/m.8216 type:complete len:204 (-) Transcript_2739:340-951(-)
MCSCTTRRPGGSATSPRSTTSTMASRTRASISWGSGGTSSRGGPTACAPRVCSRTRMRITYGACRPSGFSTGRPRDSRPPCRGTRTICVSSAPRWRGSSSWTRRRARTSCPSGWTGTSTLRWRRARWASLRAQVTRTHWTTATPWRPCWTTPRARARPPRSAPMPPGTAAPPGASGQPRRATIGWRTSSGATWFPGAPISTGP